MLAFILSVVLAIFFTSVGLQNPTLVPVSFFNYSFTLPLFFVAAVSFLTGVIVTFLFHLVDRTAATIDTNAVTTQLRDLNRGNENLRYQVQELANENANLRSQLGNTQANLRGERVENTKEGIKSFFGRLRHRINPHY